MNQPCVGRWILFVCGACFLMGCGSGGSAEPPQAAPEPPAPSRTEAIPAEEPPAAQATEPAPSEPGSPTSGSTEDEESDEEYRLRMALDTVEEAWTGYDDALVYGAEARITEARRGAHTALAEFIEPLSAEGAAAWRVSASSPLSVPYDVAIHRNELQDAIAAMQLIAGAQPAGRCLFAQTFTRLSMHRIGTTLYDDAATAARRLQDARDDGDSWSAEEADVAAVAEQRATFDEADGEWEDNPSAALVRLRALTLGDEAQRLRTVAHLEAVVARCPPTPAP